MEGTPGRAGDWDRGLLLVLLSAAGFALMPVMVKVAYSHGVPLLSLLAYRFLGATVVLCAVVRLKRLPLPERAAVPSLLLLGLAFVGVSLTMYLALHLVSASLASLVFYVYPVLVTATSAILFSESFGVQRLLVLAVAMTGCGLIFAQRFPAGRTVEGVLLALASAVAYAAYIMIGHHARRSASYLVTATAVVMVGAVAYVIPAAASGALAPAFSLKAWLAIGTISLVSTAIPLWAFLEGMERVGPSRAALASTIEPALTLAFAATLLGDRLGPLQYVGGALLITAVAALRLESQRRAQVPAAGPVEGRLEDLVGDGHA